jgi:tetratricopeptide (TPR) repeat protein
MGKFVAVTGMGDRHGISGDKIFMSGFNGGSAPAQPNPFLQAKLKSGLALQQQGRLAEAARLYEDILAADKTHFAALHCLGAIAYQTGNLERAVRLISDAVRINPRVAAADPYRGAALNQLNRHDESLAVCNEAIKLKPDFAEAHYNRGNALYGLGRSDEALASYDRAIAVKPEFAEAWSNRGNALQHLGRMDEALASCDRAIAQKPNYVPAHYNRGNALYDLRRFDEALASYNKAIELKPDYAQAYYNRGKTLADLKRPEEALASYDRAIALKPDYAQAWSNRGNLLTDTGRFEDALASFDKAIALKPDHAEAWSNRGTALQYLNRLGEAMADHNKAIDLKPDYAEAHCNRGSVLNCLRRPGEALASFNRAIVLKPDFGQAYFNRAMTELGMGDMQSGWPDFEWRRKIVEMSGGRVFPRPLLTSLADVRGKTILVHFEHGFGDTIQYCRYLEPLNRAGAKILFHCQEQLKSLMKSLNAPITFADLDDPSQSYDYHVPLMSMPLLFETTLETIPSKPSYLSADSALVEKWRGRLGGDGFKIGICWMGDMAHIKGHNGRFFPVACFEPLAKLPGVRLISLQKGDGEKQLASLPAAMTVEPPGDDWKTFADTAAIMKCLDLVITTDTVIANLAGALGVPTWVAIQYVPDWKWMFDRPDSPWYPTMRLFRQKMDGDWQGVFEDMKEALAGLQTSPQANGT